MRNLLSAFSVVIFLSACSTDFDTIAPYKETMVIYGLLDMVDPVNPQPSDSFQYVRISKAYLGEGNSLIMAQQPDSIYYGDILDVKLERYLNNNLVNSYPMTRTDTVPKDTGGTFVAPYQVVYVCKLAIPNDASVYKLIVKNKNSGVIATASTKIIENFFITIPPIIDFTTPPAQVPCYVTPSALGRLYSINMKINYVETDKLDTTKTFSKFINWYLGDQTFQGSTSVKMTFPITKSEFFPLVQNSVSKNPNLKYTFTGIDAYVSGGTDDLYTYIQVTKPATGIVQYRPLYSNVENGVGLFTFRNTRLRHIALSPSTINVLDSIYQ